MSENQKPSPASPSALSFRNSVLSSIGNASSQSSASRPSQQGKEVGSIEPLGDIGGSQSTIRDVNASCLPSLPPDSYSSPSKAASQLFSKTLIRRRSSLFENLVSKSRTRAEKSSSFFQQRLSQNSTWLDNGESQCTVLPPPVGEKKSSLFGPSLGEKKSSLFGAVMQKFSSTASASFSTESIPTTPTRMKSTNSDSSSQDAKPSYWNSPSGNKLKNMVNRLTAMNSPFRFQSPKAKRLRTSISSPASDSKSPVFTPSPSKRKRRRLNSEIEDSMSSRSSLHDDDNWQEATIHKHQAEILDWSLKKKLRLECHPLNSIHRVTSCQQWMKHLMYWQYPVRNIPTPSLMQRTLSQTTVGLGKKRLDTTKKEELSQLPDQKSAAATAVQQSSPSNLLATKLIQSVKGPNARFSRNNSGKEWKNDHQTLQQEWQEALRSLFLNWCRKVEELAAQNNIKEAMLDSYFYCVAEDHVVLCRVETSEEKPFYRPRVVLSSCCHNFQKKMISIGVEHMEFLEQEKQPSDASRSQSRSNSDILPMSPTVKADLEALRRAQAYGECAGADVYVKIKKNNSQHPDLNANKNLGPVTIRGFDNVSAFFELYRNDFGRINDGNESLPVLLCRDLGPFLHASCKSLKVYPVKQPTGGESKDVDAIEIEGFVLPCVIRKIIGCAAERLEGSNNQLANPPAVGLAASNDGVAGSHYIVLHAITEKQPLNRPLGANGSLVFNGWRRDENDRSGTLALDNEILECRRGTVLQLVVWDSSREQVVACKVEPALTGSLLNGIVKGKSLSFGLVSKKG